MLLPIKLAVSKAQLAFIERYPEQWLSIGIHVQKLSNLAIQIRQFPALLRKKDVSQSFYTILDALEAQQDIHSSGQANDNEANQVMFNKALAKLIKHQ